MFKRIASGNPPTSSPHPCMRHPPEMTVLLELGPVSIVRPDLLTLFHPFLQRLEIFSYTLFDTFEECILLTDAVNKRETGRKRTRSFLRAQLLDGSQQRVTSASVSPNPLSRSSLFFSSSSSVKTFPTSLVGRANTRRLFRGENNGMRVERSPPLVIHENR